MAGTTLLLARVLMKKNVSAELQDRNKHAAITAIILSVIMLFCYTPTQVIIILKRLDLDMEVWEAAPNADWVVVLRNVLPMLLLSVNSAVNPIVYIARKEAMRLYFLNLLYSVSCNLSNLGLLDQRHDH